jgi:hypothetical protein
MHPTDRSENAKIGMAYAVSLAREHKAELIFLHVTQFPWRQIAYFVDSMGSRWRTGFHNWLWNIYWRLPPPEWRASFIQVSGLKFRVCLGRSAPASATSRARSLRRRFNRMPIVSSWQSANAVSCFVCLHGAFRRL